VKKDIDFLRANRNEELNAVLASPIVRGDKKSKIFKAIFHGKVSQLTESFFDLVFSKGREFVMRDIGDAFDQQYNEIKGIVNVTITSAIEMAEEIHHDLYSRVANLPRFHDKTVNLETKVDPKLIGGFIIEVGDLKFDASIRHDLHFIKREFIKNLYEMKY
jgi:F-type H+-transporting ATPase subunit delta